MTIPALRAPQLASGQRTLPQPQGYLAKPATRGIVFSRSKNASFAPTVAESSSPRELAQQVLKELLMGGDASRVREIAMSRPDLMEAASAEQRAQMSRTLLERFFFGSGDRIALLAILRPALALGEFPQTLAIIKSSGKLAALFKQLRDVEEGLEFAKLGLAAGIFNDLGIAAEMGQAGVRSVVRVATDEDLDALARSSKSMMIGILQSGQMDDETEIMVRRIRNHLH